MDEELFTQVIEILKASVPIFSIIAVIIAATLNARFTRKQKVRDELFSYKVKAYMKIAEVVYGIKGDYMMRIDAIISKVPLTNSKLKSPPNTKDFFGKEYETNILFLEKHIENKVHKFVSNLISLSKEHVTFSNVFSHDLTNNYFKIVCLCDELLDDLQKEIGLDKIKTK